MTCAILDHGRGGRRATSTYTRVRCRIRGQDRKSVTFSAHPVNGGAISTGWSGQVVWVTGASSGIGAHLATALSAAGASLVLSARNVAALERVRLACAAPDRVRVVPLDLEAEGSLANAVRSAEQAFGRVDLFISNAGLAVRDFALATSSDVDRRVMTINYLAPVALIKALLPAMIARGSGRIVIISSLSAKFGVPRSAAYSASKHAMLGFIDSLRLELRNSGVRCTVVIPGVIRTPITEHALSGSGAPTGKMERSHEEGMPADECAALIVRGLEGSQDEFAVGRAERFMLPFRRLFPRAFYRFLGSHPVRRLRGLRDQFQRKPRS